jgi:ribosomal protein L37E
VSEADEVAMTICRRCGRETIVGKYGHVCAACVEVQRSKSPVIRQKKTDDEDIDSESINDFRGDYSAGIRAMEDRK